eukprot:351509-Chlamydomonas_euryale.AAC.4
MAMLQQHSAALSAEPPSLSCVASSLGISVGSATGGAADLCVASVCVNGHNVTHWNHSGVTHGCVGSVDWCFQAHHFLESHSPGGVLLAYCTDRTDWPPAKVRGGMASSQGQRWYGLQPRSEVVWPPAKVRGGMACPTSAPGWLMRIGCYP